MKRISKYSRENLTSNQTKLFARAYIKVTVALSAKNKLPSKYYFDYITDFVFIHFSLIDRVM